MRSFWRKPSCRALILFTALFCSGAAALGLDQEALRPKLVVPETAYDFGTVTQGTKVKHDFVVRNQGKADLTIQRVVASCGCTATTASQGTVPPSGEATISVEFDTSGFSGEQLKTARLYTNDFDQPSMLISVKGVIQPDVVINPRSVLFQDVIRGLGKSAEQEVTLDIRQGSSVVIESIKSYSSYVSVREVKTEGRRRTIAVAIAPEAPVGELRDRLIVALKNGPQSSAINIPVLAVVRGKLKLDPATLSFGILEGNQPLVRSLKFENRGASKVSITGVQSDNPAVKANYKSIQDGKLYVIQVEVDPKSVDQDLRASLEVLTNSPDEPSLTLSIYGILPPKM